MIGYSQMFDLDNSECCLFCDCARVVFGSSLLLLSLCVVSKSKVSEFGQEIPHSHTADQATSP